MNNTFILLARSILDSEVFASQKMLKIWVWCLCKANHKDNFIPIRIGRGEKVVQVNRGQFLFGRFTAEDELFIDGSTIYKIMKKLEEIGNITIESNNQYSIVTICNYDTYQDPSTYGVATKEQPSNSKRTAKEQPSNSKRTQTKNEKNEKNVNNDKNKYREFVSMSKVEYEKLIEKYGKEDTEKMIDTLDNYKGSKGKSYKSDYRAILSWVADKVAGGEKKTIGIPKHIV